MGMLIDGIWDGTADRSMQDGTYRREMSAMLTTLDAQSVDLLRTKPSRFVLVASASCPWSHATVLASVFKGFAGRLPLQLAGGPRVQGYGIRPNGPLSAGGDLRHLHQLYSQSDAAFTGRATVPVLWDRVQNRILSNSSADILRAFNQAGSGPDLCPEPLRDEIEKLTASIFDGLSNAVYRAGKAERQDEYDAAVDLVFATMEQLEARLSERVFLFGADMTESDLRLFATLVRFDTVYATHFRCTRKRLVDYPALWRFTRRIFQMPGISDTVDFDEIRAGYYLNDGSHNPHNIIAQQPVIDWGDTTGL
jgi:glutathionyl-hydroquinone reductase